MLVKFSRHAKRRAKLYRIPTSTIEAVLLNLDLDEGEHDLIEKVAGFGYPIKIAVAVESGTITVITNYPLKKGRRQ